MMTKRHHVYVCICDSRLYRLGVLLLLWAWALAGCGTPALPPAHATHHKPVGVYEGQHLRYQSPDRHTWQYPERVIEALHLEAGMQVADLGSGTGYFTFRLTEAVGPAGKVYAVDIDEDMNASVDKQAIQKQVNNVQTVLAAEHDPRLPEQVDLIFSVNVYHHLQNRTAYFKNAARYLKPGGRVAIIDFREGAFRHFTKREILLAELQAAGYTLAKEYDFLPRQHFLVFSRGPQ